MVGWRISCWATCEGLISGAKVWGGESKKASRDRQKEETSRKSRGNQRRKTEKSNTLPKRSATSGTLDQSEEGGTADFWPFQGKGVCGEGLKATSAAGGYWKVVRRSFVESRTTGFSERHLLGHFTRLLSPTNRRELAIQPAGA